MARAATELMLGRSLADLKLTHRKIPHFGVKESVFPFDKLPEVDPVLGPEMRSTGEVLGMAGNYGLAFYKAQEAANAMVPCEGTVLISLSEKPEQALDVAKAFAGLGFRIVATSGTCQFLTERGVSCTRIGKIGEDRPNVVDAIVNRTVGLVINTPSPRRGSHADDASIRKASIRARVPYVTTLAAALATARGIEAARTDRGGVKSLQAYHADIV
jgi:carbamoyl-phosphate synthase large subunit